jgi:hypothetical protein
MLSAVRPPAGSAKIAAFAAIVEGLEAKFPSSV